MRRTIPPSRFASHLPLHKGGAERAPKGSPVQGELSAKQTEGLFALTLIEPDKFVKLAALHQSFVKILVLTPSRLDEYTSYGV